MKIAMVIALLALGAFSFYLGTLRGSRPHDPNTKVPRESAPRRGILYGCLLEWEMSDSRDFPCLLLSPRTASPS